jgi:hypothetical protein
MWKAARESGFFALVIRARNPNLVRHYHHHKQEVESKCPDDYEFGTLKPTPWDGLLLGAHELIMFERC